MEKHRQHLTTCTRFGSTEKYFCVSFCVFSVLVQQQSLFDWKVRYKEALTFPHTHDILSLVSEELYFFNDFILFFFYAAVLIPKA